MILTWEKSSQSSPTPSARSSAPLKKLKCAVASSARRLRLRRPHVSACDCSQEKSLLDFTTRVTSATSSLSGWAVQCPHFTIVATLFTRSNRAAEKQPPLQAAETDDPPLMAAISVINSSKNPRTRLPGCGGAAAAAATSTARWPKNSHSADEMPAAWMLRKISVSAVAL